MRRYRWPITKWKKLNFSNKEKKKYVQKIFLPLKFENHFKIYNIQEQDELAPI